MKLTIFIIFLFFLSDAYGQTPHDQYKEMIDSAISITCQKNLKHPGDSFFKDLYLIDDNYNIYNYNGTYTWLGFKRMNVLDSRNIHIVRKGIRAWKIIPVLKDNILRVTIIHFIVTYKNRNYNFSNGGGSESLFEYLCNECKWILIKSECQGL